MRSAFDSIQVDTLAKNLASNRIKSFQPAFVQFHIIINSSNDEYFQSSTTQTVIKKQNHILLCKERLRTIHLRQI